MALATSMVFAGVAVANDDVESAVAALDPVVVVDEEAGTISIALPVDGELPECPPEEGDGEGGDGEGPIQTDDEVDGEEEGDGEEGDDEVVTYGPGDCIELVMEHPSGKTHHGAVVSTAAKALHPSMLDGIKKGEIMRWVAKSGKSGDEGDDDGDDGDDGDEGDDGEKPEKGTKPEKGNKPEKGDDHPGKGKDKRDKATKDDTSDRGNRRADHPGKGKGRNG